MINWSEHTEQTKNTPPRPLLVKALEFVQGRNFALDLGAGALSDTKYLVESGFKKVISLDKDGSAQDIYNTLPKERVDYVISAFENYFFPINSYDLVNAQYCLPFCERVIWSSI